MKEHAICNNKEHRRFYESHPKLGLLRFELCDGWIYIYHRTGKLLNAHKQEKTNGTND